MMNNWTDWEAIGYGFLFGFVVWFVIPALLCKYAACVTYGVFLGMKRFDELENRKSETHGEEETGAEIQLAKEGR